jgi:hypothetical protein
MEQQLLVGGTALVLRGLNATVDVARLGLPIASRVLSVPSGAAIATDIRTGKLAFAAPDFSISTVLAIG